MCQRRNLADTKRIWGVTLPVHVLPSGVPGLDISVSYPLNLVNYIIARVNQKRLGFLNYQMFCSVMILMSDNEKNKELTNFRS